MKWSRKNITATMERFEPTGDPPRSPCLNYGLAATVVASIKEETDDVQILTLSMEHQKILSPWALLIQ